MSAWSPSVVRLLLAGGPSAVIRAVRSVVVDAVDGRSGRSFTHVLEEGREVRPSLADCDSTSTVVGESAVCGVKASLPKAAPHPINRMRLAPSMLCEAREGDLGSVATARCNQSTSEMPTIDRFGAATVASAEPPITVWAKRGNFFYCHQAAEFLAGNVNLPARHAGNIASNWLER